jgi:hypothetical protein
LSKLSQHFFLDLVRELSDTPRAVSVGKLKERSNLPYLDVVGVGGGDEIQPLGSAASSRPTVPAQGRNDHSQGKPDRLVTRLQPAQSMRGIASCTSLRKKVVRSAQTWARMRTRTPAQHYEYMYC